MIFFFPRGEQQIRALQTLDLYLRITHYSLRQLNFFPFAPPLLYLKEQEGREKALNHSCIALFVFYLGFHLGELLTAVISLL